VGVREKMAGQSNPMPAPEQKAACVRAMFGRIARRYDLMNRVMTFGRDRTWRRFTVAAALNATGAPTGRGGREWILDVATGTGDLALEALRQESSIKVVGLDYTPEMLALAQLKAANRARSMPLDCERTDLKLTKGDALRLPFPDGLFDAVLTGFALRNVTDILALFREMARVTRPGGRVACLEITKPRLPLFRWLFAIYFYRLVPWVGRWITGEPTAYTYLPHSLTSFLSPDEIVDLMRRTGWGEVAYRRLMLGTVAVHLGVRE